MELAKKGIWANLLRAYIRKENPDVLKMINWLGIIFQFFPFRPKKIQIEEEFQRLLERFNFCPFFAFQRD